jgi:protein SCO1/2
MIARPLLASLAALAAGAVALDYATDGFRVVTAEGARRLAVAESPRLLPDVELEDQDGRRFRLNDYRGRPLLVGFFYTRCPTVCTQVNDAFHRLRAALPAEGEGAPVVINITFDPGADTIEAIRDYGRAFGADGRTWRFARPRDSAARDALLAAFGIVVIPDTFGGFDHNAAIHMVDRQGRLARIYDLDEVDAAARAVRDVL